MKEQTLSAPTQKEMKAAETKCMLIRIHACRPSYIHLHIFFSRDAKCINNAYMPTIFISNSGSNSSNGSSGTLEKAKSTFCEILRRLSVLHPPALLLREIEVRSSLKGSRTVCCRCMHHSCMQPYNCKRNFS